MPRGQGGLPLGSFVLRHAAGAAPTDALLRRALRDIDPDVVLERSQTTRALVDGVLAPARLLSTAMTMLGATGLMLLALGIFGAAATTLRVARREVGIRQAIGATPLGAARAPLRSLLTALGAGALAGAIAAPGAVSVLAAMGVADRARDGRCVGRSCRGGRAGGRLAIGINIRRATAVSPAELLRTSK